MCQTQSDQINEIAKALAAAQAELEPAARNAENPHLRNRYADLSAVYDAIRKVLPKHGLAVAQVMLPRDDGKAHVRTTLLHESGQWLAGECVMPCDKQGGIQGMGSAITYARRYSLSAIVGVVSEVDDDAEAACKGDRDGRGEAPRRNAPDPAPKPERVNLAALAKDLSEVRDSAGYVACWNRHRILEGHPDYEAVRNMFGKKRKEIEARAEAAPPDFVPLDEVIAAFEAAGTTTALRETAIKLNIPENHPDCEAIHAAYRERQRRIEAHGKEYAA